MRDALNIRLDGRSPGWLADARALVRDAGHRLWQAGAAPPDIVLAEERLIGVPPGALGVVADRIGDGLRRRLEALLSRPAAVEVPLADGRVDLTGERVVRGEVTPLTAVEAALLRRLLRAEGRTVSRADLLRDVWGVGPGVRTRALDTAVRRLRAKIERDRRRPTHLLTAHGIGYRFVPAPAPEALPPHDLGPEGDRLFGREAAIAAVERALAAGRWVTLVGPGGAGKTRLAVACARRLLPRCRPGGAWLCALGDADTDDADPIGAAVARALGLPGAPDPTPALIARGRALLVLDDLDRAPDPGPRIAAWLTAAPALSVIATARRATGHPAEGVYAPGPLDADAAAALFRHRSGLGDDPAIGPLVERVDRLPLAVVLAAERARLLPPAALLARLDDPAARVRLLSRPGDEGRHGAVDRVLAGSWALLDPRQRRVARRCAVFRGGFTAEAAERVCAEPDTLDALHGLVRLSLVRAPVAGRLALFETVRGWLALRLDAAGEAAATAARHRAWCVERAVGFATASLAERARRMGPITAERHDLRAAAGAGDLPPDDRAALAVTLSAVFARTGPFAVARAAVEGAGDGASPAWRARLACARARHAVRQGSPADGWAALAESLADRERLPAPTRAAVLLDAARCAPDPARSAALAEAADAAFVEAGDPVGRAAARMIRARIAYRAGRPDRAMGHALDAVDAYRRAGVDDLLAPALANLALTFVQRGRWPEARRCAAEARRVAGRIGDRATDAIGVAVDGYIALHHEAFAEAAEHLAEAVRRQRALALRGVALQNGILAGLAGVLAGRAEAGRALVDAAARDAVGAAPALRALAEACSAALAAMAGEQALARHRAADARRGPPPPAPSIAEATGLFLAIVDAADDHGRAARLLAEADVRATAELTVRCARWLLALRLSPRAR